MQSEMFNLQLGLLRLILIKNKSFINNSKTLFTCSRKYNSNKSTDTSSKVNFGFETVSEEEKSEKVYNVFKNVADKYDIMNDVMSVGIHRLWKDCFIQVLKPTPGTELIDVAGGTGDIAYRFLKYIESYGSTASRMDHLDIDNPLSFDDSADSPSSSTGSTYEFSHHSKIKESHMTVCDINEAMLVLGKRKFENYGIKKGISWIQGNAESLRVSNNSYDAYTIAFGIRNVTHIAKALSEAYRVLKPGGRLLCLEFSQVHNPLVSWMYDAYSFQIIPAMGQIIARDWKSYQYLVESIRLFPNQEEFKILLEDTGFKMVHYQNLTFGVAAIHSGYKL